MAEPVVNRYGLRLPDNSAVSGDFPVTAINELYSSFMNRRVDTISIDLVCDLMEIARKIGMGAHGFWDMAECSPYLYGANRDFIEETFAFIHGSDRTMRPETWSHLIEYSDDRKPVHDVRGKHARISAGVGLPNDACDMVELWVKRPEGVADMLCTMYVLFCGNPLI